MPGSRKKLLSRDTMFPRRKSRRRRICRKEPAASCLKPDRLIVSPTDKLDEAEKSSNKYQTAKNRGERGRCGRDKGSRQLFLSPLPQRLLILDVFFFRPTRLRWLSSLLGPTCHWLRGSRSSVVPRLSVVAAGSSRTVSTLSGFAQNR